MSSAQPLGPQRTPIRGEALALVTAATLGDAELIKIALLEIAKGNAEASEHSTEIVLARCLDVTYDLARLCGAMAGAYGESVGASAQEVLQAVAAMVAARETGGT